MKSIIGEWNIGALDYLDNWADRVQPFRPSGNSGFTKHWNPAATGRGYSSQEKIFPRIGSLLHCPPVPVDVPNNGIKSQLIRGNENMNSPRIFKSSCTNTSFPWNVFFTLLAFWIVLFSAWAWAGGKSILFGTAISVIISLCLALFNQKLRVISARPVLIINESGIHIPDVVDMGEIPWNNISQIKYFHTETQKGKQQECLGFDVFNKTDFLRKTTISQKILWFLAQFMTMRFRQGHTYRIVAEQLTEPLQVVIAAIKPHKTVELE